MKSNLREFKLTKRLVWQSEKSRLSQIENGPLRYIIVFIFKKALWTLDHIQFKIHNKGYKNCNSIHAEPYSFT